MASRPRRPDPNINHWRPLFDAVYEMNTAHHERRRSRPFTIELLATPAQLDAALFRYGATVGINTDRNRWLGFQTPKYSLSRYDHRAANRRWRTSAP